MYTIDFKKPIHVHFIGIGGISMSGLAEILLGAGFTVSGSDTKPSALTKQLEERGAKVFYGQCAENISADYDCVVYTALSDISDKSDFIGVPQVQKKGALQNFGGFATLL